MTIINLHNHPSEFSRLLIEAVVVSLVAISVARVVVVVGSVVVVVDRIVAVASRVDFGRIVPC